MKPGKPELGSKNIIGHLRLKKNIKQKELLARLQINGVDISPSALQSLKARQDLLRILSL